MTPIGTAEVSFLGWWRTSSGMASGDEYDDMIQRSPDGLPWLPGRTLKGLLRDAAAQLAALGHGNTATIEQLFGSALQPADTGASTVADRFLSTAGTLRVGSAEMTEEWRNWAAGLKPSEQRNHPVINALFDRRAMTAVEPGAGTAKTGSLRTVEVVAPLKLTAPLHVTGGGNPGALLTQAAQLIKSIGAGRNRGFGRVAISISKGGAA